MESKRQPTQEDQEVEKKINPEIPRITNKELKNVLSNKIVHIVDGEVRIADDYRDLMRQLEEERESKN